MDSMVKKSLAVPIKKLTSCVSEGKDQDSWSLQRGKRARGGKGRSAAPRPGQQTDPSVIRAYQADLEKERKLREAMNAQKNAERAAMRTHFRRKYQLSKSSTDASRLRAVGGKVALPRDLAAMVRPEAPPSDEGYSLLKAFQGLSFNMGVLSGTKQTKTPTPAPDGECKIM
ncbi:complexin-3-like [Denticeps clupeoides]|uniref:complexin-3-like n=1 Tax=Denticeps clupeoides TaxID=299321 RepID=UPI0010A315CE|nr:complexin-3-like [Denticeps clupeoides]